jgi:hypothetical protein
LRAETMPPIRLAALIALLASLALAAVPIWYWQEQGQSSWQLAMAAVVLAYGGLGAHTFVLLAAVAIVAARQRSVVIGLCGATPPLFVCTVGMILIAEPDDQPLAMALIGAWAVLCAAASVWLALRTTQLSP